VQLGRTTSALRFRVWIDDEPFEKGVEIIGDGFLVSTPFGSTAYYRQITRGIFYSGLGIAFKFTSELINHLVIREESVFRAEVTRGPAVVAHDNAPDAHGLDSGDEVVIRRDSQVARVLAWERLKRPSEEL
jgi:NAD+ kinase